MEGKEHPRIVTNPDEPIDLGPPDLPVVSIEQRKAILRAALPPEESVRYTQLDEDLRPLEEKLRILPEVQRLQWRDQLGGKANPEILPDSPDDLAVYTPAFHTRFDHCELAAELSKVVSAHLRLSPERAKVLLAAAWLHDTGHSAFSHIGEGVVREQEGGGGHEERTEKIIRGSAREALEKEKVIPENVVSLVQEKGGLGAVQSLLDTLSYLIVDTEAMGRDEFPDLGVSLIADIVGINARENLLIVRSSEPFQSLLEMRAAAMKDIYYHPKNRMKEEARRQLLRLAIRRGHIEPQELSEAPDMELTLRLQSLVQQDRNAALLGGRTSDTPLMSDCKDLWSLESGVVPHGWERTEHGTEEEKNSYLASKPAAVIEKSVVVPPHDYTKKQLRVLVARSAEEKEEVTLRARNTQLRPEDTKWVVYARVKE